MLKLVVNSSVQTIVIMMFIYFMPNMFELDATYWVTIIVLSIVATMIAQMMHMILKPMKLLRFELINFIINLLVVYLADVFTSNITVINLWGYIAIAFLLSYVRIDWKIEVE